MFISAAAAIRDASSSTSKLEQCTKINQKIMTPTGKTGRSGIEGKDSKKARLDRYRPAIFYDDDDENTSNPRLEKIINEDKERIERERKESIDKKKAKKDSSRDEKTKNKMETSAQKFKVFLQDDPVQVIDNGKKTQKEDDDDLIEAASAKVDLTLSQSPQASPSPQACSKSPDLGTPVAWKPKKKRQSTVNQIDDSDVDEDDIFNAKTQSPVKASPRTSRSASPEPSTPPVWKAKNKRQSDSAESSASKRSRKSSERDTPLDEILRGIVFAISGIQVKHPFIPIVNIYISFSQTKFLLF